MEDEGIPLPPDEADRLHDLRQLGLVQDEPVEDPLLERVPALAKMAADRPWAGVSIVDEQTQWFLVVDGPFDEPVPRSLSPCARAILRPEEVHEVPDMADTERFAGSPAVADARVRFYAGAPIQSPRGLGLGTVCVLDERPSELGQAEREALSAASAIASLGLQLRQRARQLEEANEQLESFATFVSHELTDPVSEIVGNIELALMDLQDPEPASIEEAREGLLQAREGADRLDAMVKDLLRYARASGRPLDKRTVDLSELLGETASSVQRAHPEAEIHVETRMPSVPADPQLIQRVLTNLLENAFEHGGEPARVHVGARELEHAWRIWVEDEGEGLPPSEAERIFELFQTGSRSGSSGVGLALCKRIVDRHDGRIGVDPRPGEGARFWFTLPRGETRS